MNRLKSLWNCGNYNKIFEILDNPKRNYEVLFTINIKPRIFKRVGHKLIRLILMTSLESKPKRNLSISIEEIRLHNLKKYGLFIINYDYLYFFSFTRKEFMGTIQNKHISNDTSLFINSVLYMICRQERGK